VFDKDGFTQEKIDWVKELKTLRRGRISEYATEFGAEYFEGKTPWGIECDVALPCATQNEITGQDARTLISNGCMAVSEGANMPTYAEGVQAFLDAKVLFGPAKAANAGGVAMSGLEMSQNAGKRSWGEDELSRMLREIMQSIHDRCREAGDEGDYCNYAKGANIAGFKKVGDAVLAFGVV